MKVNMNGNNTTLFMDVQEGETFLYGGQCYIKALDEKSGMYYAINLHDGLFNNEIDDIDDVLVVNTEVNVINCPF
jgi:hypothetical protein